MSGKSKARPEEAKKDGKRGRNRHRDGRSGHLMFCCFRWQSHSPLSPMPAIHLRTCNPLVICPTALEGNGLNSGHLFLSFPVVAHNLLLIHVHLPQYSTEKHHMESPSETSQAGQHPHTTHIAGVQRGVSKSGCPTFAWNMATRGLTTTAIFTGTHVTHPSILIDTPAPESLIT
ncbi:hypothetical protein GE21DRAFT_1353336 [Neurospora crassa]|nr:hypothetical protein GE21DRAFT_1353336 [Neurospora crassa]